MPTLNKFDGSRLLLANLGLIPLSGKTDLGFIDTDQKITFQTAVNFLDQQPCLIYIIFIRFIY